MFRPMYSKQVFVIWTLFGFISVFRLAALLKLEIPVSFFLSFIASSFRVTEENLVIETVQPGPYSSFEYFLCLKGTHFYILSILEAIGYFQIVYKAGVQRNLT